MNDRQEANLSTLWVRFGLAAGLLAGLCYFFRFVRKVVPLPEPLQLVPWFMFGVFLTLYSIGLYHFLKRHRDSPALQSAVILNVIAGAFVTAQFVVQSATFTIGFDSIRAAPDSEKAIAQQIMNNVNAAQLGLGMCWDIFISCGTVLFAVTMLRHPRFGAWFSWSGIVVALAALALNFVAFPMPPSESGLIDFGPGIAVWYAAVAIPMYRWRNLPNSE